MRCQLTAHPCFLKMKASGCFSICVIDNLVLCLLKQIVDIVLLRFHKLLGGIDFCKGQTVLLAEFLPHGVEKLLPRN